MAIQVNGKSYASTPGELLRAETRKRLLRQAEGIERALASCGMPDEERARFQAQADACRIGAKALTAKGAK